MSMKIIDGRIQCNMIGGGCPGKCQYGPCSSGSVGPTGPTGPAGATAATIPFSISKYGVSLITDTQGEPFAVAFSGFGSPISAPEYLQEGEWATGTITIREEMILGPTFIMPRDGVIENIYVMFSTVSGALFEENSTIFPFVCIAVSDSDNLVYAILQDSIVYTDPYEGGIEYPMHAIRRGSMTNIGIPIAEGSLVAIVAGIRGENVTTQQYATCTVSGGIYME